ncbi:ferredoxin reductase [Xaviernesmea oryzae]|uniref:Ferredoxin reductase n=1 Tax=Xaviernesmea oryzae TaxID=464029 RepID=A0A1Q9AUU2_9HYPH|nr:FAD-dependent oxidoreductase [Xaviernesmea oryzae]OLP59199.1 ferredoxin reductase [Xaviernesmea oryzae]SEK82037.1 3-phenylpropionate/trans-cinnamate dioxygenase ferredoxin reductase subunit [Xaviernesmea oryzae]
MAAGIVIVGAGECGARAAFALRERGYQGPLTLVGAERHLPYERPPLSKALSMDGPKLVASLDAYQEAGITLMLATEARGIDRQAKALRLAGADGETTLAYDRLLLTTGARPRRLPGMTDASRYIRTLRTADDAAALTQAFSAGQHVVLIGGGFIGLELAATARQRGAAVTLLEAGPRILARGVPAEMAEIVAKRHSAEGVRILTGATMTALTEHEGGAEIKLGSGERLEADLVLVGIGAVPNVELAAAAGLAIDNGIAVDRHLTTSDPLIFAAGDCCSFPLPPGADGTSRRVRLEAWRNAQEQAALAAANLLGEQAVHAAVPWFWSDQYDLTLQVAGLAQEGDRIVRRDMGAEALILFHLDSEGRLTAAAGIGPGNAVARDIRLAEMMIANGARPDPTALASSATKLKSLLAA